MRVGHAVPLAPRTTLGVGGAARILVHAETIDELHEALALARTAGHRVLVLGGGSNLVVRDGGWDGLAIEIGLPGVAIEDHGDHAIVRTGAGVVWDRFVAQMVETGLVGVECLSGIPGLVGATPMQNVGAYGQAVADTVVSVRALDRDTDQIVELAPDACQFSYRSSAFKGSERWIIVEVTFRLRRGELSAPFDYPELARALGGRERAPLGEVRDKILELRRGKGMVVDPTDPESRSAGSFFMNPIIDAAVLAAVQARLAHGEQMPCFAAPDGHTKLSAGWLIEHAGFAKGYTVGRVGVSRKHALALVNRGGATTTELLALAAEIQAGVRARFGIELHPEPVIVGDS